MLIRYVRLKSVATANSAACHKFRIGNAPTVALVKIWFRILKPQLYVITSFEGNCCRLRSYRYATPCIPLESYRRSILLPLRCGIFLGNRRISTRHSVTRRRTVVVFSLEVFQGPGMFKLRKHFSQFSPLTTLS